MRAGSIPQPIDPIHGTGADVRQLRRALRLTLGDLSDKSEISETTLKKIEAGKPTRPGSLRRAIEALNQYLVAALEKSSRASAAGAELGCQWLQLPTQQWNRDFMGPASLLNAEFRTVPFHGADREEELARLIDWCRTTHPLGIRVYNGPGGIGKTRLALELCHALLKRSRGEWTTGFLVANGFRPGTNPWASLANRSGGVLVVVDYAGSAEMEESLRTLLANLRAGPLRIRLLLLDRDDLFLNRLRENKAARAVLSAATVQTQGFSLRLPPVAASPSERAEAFDIARKAFARELRLPEPTGPIPALKGKAYEQVLFLHMRALSSVYGKESSDREASILSHVLDRERQHWSARAERLGLERRYLPAIEAAVCSIGLNGGADSLTAAERVLAEVNLLKGESPVTLNIFARLLRECYPAGDTGIAPLQPDRLREFLEDRFLRRKVR